MTTFTVYMVRNACGIDWTNVFYMFATDNLEEHFPIYHAIRTAYPGYQVRSRGVSLDLEDERYAYSDILIGSERLLEKE